jgi:hypothetical protein
VSEVVPDDHRFLGIALEKVRIGSDFVVCECQGAGWVVGPPAGWLGSGVGCAVEPGCVIGAPVVCSEEPLVPWVDPGPVTPRPVQ